MTQRLGMAAYITVTAAYWALMLTDGALRMLVLLHFHTLGFSPVQLAYLFVLYEVAGVITNLSAGYIAARFGLTSTLYTGLALQIAALIGLIQLNPTWSTAASVVFVMAVQGVSGVAKDLAKMSSKSAVKVLAPTQGDGLFRWVAFLTGSKNAVKGLGFLLGASALGALGFVPTLVAMAIILTLILFGVIWKMPSGLPRGRKDVKFKDVLSKNSNINWLSAARTCLFGARDVWFVVGIPIYFYAVWSDGTPDGNRETFFQIGVFMAIWVILYGLVQASAPRLLKAKSETDLTSAAKHWVLALFFVPAILTSLTLIAGEPAPWLTGSLITGLLIFGAIFAINSALHSYLILAFTTQDRVTMDVGFYYMANATGRLIGTLLSGLTYQIGGLALCLATAALLIALSWITMRHLR